MLYANQTLVYKTFCHIFFSDTHTRTNCSLTTHFIFGAVWIVFVIEKRETQLTVDMGFVSFKNAITFVL